MLTAEVPIDARTEPVNGVNLAAEAIMARAATENFPVATRVLGAAARRHLMAVYGFARLADELGDSEAIPPAQRLAGLDWLEAELDRVFRGEAPASAEGEHPLLVRLQASVRACTLSREPFIRLIEANRRDQRVSRYQTWAQLRDYCRLSADPVGELVLEIFGLATPARIERSNAICTALQLAEHCQDVAEDLARGRVYLPQEDLARFGCTEADLAGAHANGPVREVLAFEVTRARSLLRDGAPLIAQLRGRPKIAVAAFLAGGSAALDAIERARYDVLAGPPRAAHSRRALATVATLYASRKTPR